MVGAIIPELQGGPERFYAVYVGHPLPLCCARSSGLERAFRRQWYPTQAVLGKRRRRPAPHLDSGSGAGMTTLGRGQGERGGQAQGLPLRVRVERALTRRCASASPPGEAESRPHPPLRAGLSPRRGVCGPLDGVRVSGGGAHGGARATTRVAPTSRDGAARFLPPQERRHPPGRPHPPLRVGLSPRRGVCGPLDGVRVSGGGAHGGARATTKVAPTSRDRAARFLPPQERRHPPGRPHPPLRVGLSPRRGGWRGEGTTIRRGRAGRLRRGSRRRSGGGRWRRRS